MVSSLAEGADRVAVQRARERLSARLIAILPFAPTDFSRDFANAASRREFFTLLAVADDVVCVPRQRTRQAAYARAGGAIVDRSDVLLAVWDGRPSQGTGGTADVVSRARKRALPVVWIHAGNRKRGTLAPTSLGSSQGDVTFENWMR